MPSKAPDLPQKILNHLVAVGQQIRLARLRRGYTAAKVAELARMSRQTLSKIEGGEPNVNIGSYASVLHSLGLDADLELLASQDSLGRNLDDVKTAARQRVSWQCGSK